MSINVFIKQAGRKRDIEVQGHHTIEELYERAAEAIGARSDSFDLSHEGEDLSKEEGFVWESSLADGCELDLQYNARVVMVSIDDLVKEKKRLEAAVAADPDLTLEVNAGGSAKVLRIDGESLPKNLRSIKIVNCFATAISSSFLRYAASLLSVDLSSLDSVVTIGNYFLESCTALLAIDLAFLSSVTSIGYCFLYNCTSLTHLEFPCFRRLRSIGEHFLYNCSSLSEIDLQPLYSVPNVGKGFIQNTKIPNEQRRLPMVQDAHLTYRPCG